MQNLHNPEMNERRLDFWEKKPRLQMRRVLWAPAKAKALAAVGSGHDDGDESQQEDQNCAGDWNHDGNVFDDSFNRILRLV